MDDMQKKREAFEHAYTLSATEDQRRITLNWMASWHEGNGYSHTNLQDMFKGFLLATSTHISIQEAWELAGGNPGIKATREELESALKALDEVCDEADESISLNEVWNALGGDSSLETPSLQNVRTLLEVVGAERFKRKPRFPMEPPMDKRVVREIMGVQKEFPIQGTLSEFYKRLCDGTVDSQGNVYTVSDLTPEAQSQFDAEVERLSKMIKEMPYSVTTLPMSMGARNIEKINAVDQMFHVVWPAGRRPEGALRMEIQKERTGTKMRFDYQLPDFIVRDNESEESARLRDVAVKADIKRRDRARVDEIMRPLREFVREYRTSHRTRSVEMLLGECLKIYVRTGGNCYSVNGERKAAIEIARIDLPEHMQGKGVAKEFFTKELPRIAAMHGIHYIVVAQVHNPNFQQQLVAWGYVRDEKRIDDNIFVKVLF